MPRTLINILLIEKDKVKIYAEETVPVFIEQLIHTRNVDLSDTFNSNAADIRMLQSIFVPTYDWDRVVSRMPKNNNGHFKKFQYTLMHEANSFAITMPGGKKIVLPKLRIHPYNEKEALVTLDWMNDKKSVLNIEGFQYEDLVK